MPKTKRNRVVPLSKVTKKGFNDRKAKIFQNVVTNWSKYKYCFAFTYKNMTHMPMDAWKGYFKDSGVFLVGKNKVMQVAVGKPGEEPKENSSRWSPFLKGNCGLFFTDTQPDEIIAYFEGYSCPYFGNVGTISNQTVVLHRGFDEHLDGFEPSMESQFRQLGLKIKLDNGKFCLLDEFVVCEEGKPLNADQSKMIQHLGIYMDEFKINIAAYLGMNGEFVSLKEEKNEDGDQEM